MGCEWTEWTSYKAAYGGHLDVLKWLCQNGCSYYESTCTNAAAGGHLEVLKWLREDGCPWDKDECEYRANFTGHVHVVEWIMSLN